jgi:RNA-directed DNA polymerase
MRATLLEIKKEMQRRMHQPIPEQGKWLRQVATGFFAYHAVPTNSRAPHTFRHCVTDLWRRSLRRRSQKDRMTWSRIKKLAMTFFRKPVSFIPGLTRALPSNIQGGSRVP